MQRSTEIIEMEFLKSALHQNICHKTEDILHWIKEKNKEIQTRITEVPLSELKDWGIVDNKFQHKSGKFFSIEGISVETNYGLVPYWEQPIINQPEIGFLGFIVQKKQGILHFLLQAKIEPGNINCVQLSPTLQATKSNYTRVHEGKAPLYLEYFTGEKKVEILVDQLQSEQGARFFQKRNRNIIVEVNESEEVPIRDNFIWVTLAQIKSLLHHPNVVNMDTRTVISCIQFGTYEERDLRLLEAYDLQNNLSHKFLYSVLNSENHLLNTNQIIRWITQLKFKYELSVHEIGLTNIHGWHYDGKTISHDNGKYFSVIGVNVNIGNREVVEWDQPMIKAAQKGIIGFLVKNIEGCFHFLVQAKLEAGNFDIIELAPTVQCLTGNYRKGHNTYTVPYIEYFTNPDPNKVWYSTYQSEEGGRFFQEQNLNIIVEVGDDFPIKTHKNYCWMTLNQMLSFVTYNNYLNIAARSLLSAVTFINK